MVAVCRWQPLWRLRITHASCIRQDLIRRLDQWSNRTYIDDSCFIYFIVVITCSALVHVGIPAFEFQCCNGACRDSTADQTLQHCSPKVCEGGGRRDISHAFGPGVPLNRNMSRLLGFCKGSPTLPPLRDGKWEGSASSFRVACHPFRCAASHLQSRQRGREWGLVADMVFPLPGPPQSYLIVLFHKPRRIPWPQQPSQSVN